jgi:3-oxoacyl-[acyl-carrier protein] reductase
VLKEIEQYGVKAVMAAADVSDNEAVLSAVEHIKSELGPIDGCSKRSASKENS